VLLAGRQRDQWGEPRPAAVHRLDGIFTVADSDEDVAAKDDLLSSELLEVILPAARDSVVSV